ncbi:MAG: hypothetical protein II949_03360 [Prevotella sp.]|nr:hypothetical protein [Prevotella sp.]
MKAKAMLFLALLCTTTTAWAQTPTPSTELEQYLTMSNRMVYRFNYPSTSMTGEPVVFSSLLACWAPSAPEEGDGIESVRMYSHYTVSANSQCPTSSTLESADFVALSLLFEGGDYDASQPYKSIVKRSRLLTL